MGDFFFEGTWRMDWGFGNPNKTAALISTLMVAVWALAWVRIWGFWAALTGFTGLGFCLIHTFSRGGLVAVVVGIAPVLLFARCPWKRSHIIGVVAAVVGIAGFAAQLNATKRLVKLSPEEDGSIGNRMMIWSTAPRMMLDAPSGWGIGKSGDAFMQWYQPVDHLEGYRTLVNSHLTWLVEFGWPLRVAYVIGWAAVLIFCWPQKNLQTLSISLGIWLALAVGAFFSSVGESFCLWVVPAIAFALALVVRIKHRVWPSSRFWIVGSGISSAVLLALVTWGLMDGSALPIRHDGNKTQIGAGSPDLAVRVETKVLGKNYGKAWRRHLNMHPEIGAIFLECTKSIPATDVLVLAGRVDQDETKALSSSAPIKRLFLLNPSFEPSEWIASRTGIVIFGQFHQVSTRSAWESILPHDVEVAPG